MYWTVGVCRSVARCSGPRLTQGSFAAAAAAAADFVSLSTEKHWTSAGGGSGPGSSLNFTANVRRILLDVMDRYNVTSLLDSSCGSMHWMPLVLEEQEKKIKDFRFMGTDVACIMIDQHKTNFSNHPHWNFEVR
jgi:hypothetical protein